MIAARLTLIICASFPLSTAYLGGRKSSEREIYSEGLSARGYYYPSHDCGCGREQTGRTEPRSEHNKQAQVEPTTATIRPYSQLGRITTSTSAATSPTPATTNQGPEYTETPRVDCYRAYEQNFTCEVCETTTHNHKLMTRNCTRDAVPRDHRYRGPGVDYAKDPEFAGKPWPAGEAAAASSQSNENWTSNSKLSTQSTRKRNPQPKISNRKVHDFTA